jgi:hypothetical protein
MNSLKKGAFALLSLLSLILVAACGDSLGVADVAAGDDSSDTLPGGTPQVALVRVVLTDAPVDYIAEALVDIGRVTLVPGGEGGHIVLSEDGTDGFVNLLDFQDAVTTPIGEAEIEPGEFSQLRMIVEAAHVKLKEGYTFRDGTTEMELKVPSGAQTGIKLNLKDAEDGGPVTIVPGETVLVLDFDVSRSFVLNGNFETPAGVHGVHFKPTLRVVAMDVAASISGVVTTAVDGVSVEGLTVTAEPTDAGTVEGYQTMAGTAITDADGAYTIHFLVPGAYEVSVSVDEGLATEPATRSVTVGDSEDATGADFEVIDVSGSIAGTVTTAIDTVSVEGLTVTATPAAEGMDPMTTTTGAEGEYAFESVLPGVYVVTVEPGADLVTDPAAAEVEVGNGEDVSGVDFAILEDVRGTIAGTVSTALEGVSVEGLTVTATPAAEGAEAVTATTAADGTYLIEFVPPGDYTITVEVGDGLTTDPASRDVTIDENEEEAGADFAVVASGG